MTKKQIEARQAKANKSAARTVAALKRNVNLKKVGKVVTNDRGQKRAVFNESAKIRVLPAAKNPDNMPREGTGRAKRFNDLLKSKTVGQFLARHPKWHATIGRYVTKGCIKIVA